MKINRRVAVLGVYSISYLCGVLLIGAMGCTRETGSPEVGKPPSQSSPVVSSTSAFSSEPSSTKPRTRKSSVGASSHPKTQPRANLGPSLKSPPIRIIDQTQVASAAKEVNTGESPVANTSAGNPPAAKTNAPSLSKAKASAKSYRQPLFEGWPKPDFALVLTGRQNGYIEPCGCAGLANQKGGLARRHSLVVQLRDRGWPTALFDVGNQVRRYGRQPEIKFQMSVEGLRQIGYHAVGFGPDDLRLSSGELLAVSEPADPQNPPLLLSANAAILDREFTDSVRVIDVGRKKIGVTSVLGDSHKNKINSDEIILTSAEEGLQKAWTALEKQNCDLYVLLAYASLEETKQLARKFPGFGLVATAGGADEPYYLLQKIEGAKSQLIEVGGKGMYAAVVGVYSQGKPRLRYQSVPLDSRFVDSRLMLKILKGYQDQLEATGLAGLGLRPLKHPSGNRFVGSEKCGDCHTTAYGIWKETPHAHATDPLVHPGERIEIPRHFDPECLSCHVTGWNPQKFYPYESGYLDLKASAHLHGNGCENCHGPGSAHVAAESGETDADQARLDTLRAGMRLLLKDAQQKCVECHDLDNDPNFKPESFQEYWDQIKHYGKD